MNFYKDGEKKTMKKKFVIYSLVILVAMLASACGATTTTAQPAGGAAEDTPKTDAPEGAAEGEIPEGTPLQGGMPGEDAQAEAVVDEDRPVSIAVSVDVGEDDQAASEKTIDSEDVPALNMDGQLVIGDKTFIKSREDITVDKDDFSGAIVADSGNLTVAYGNVVTSGNTSSLNNSLNYGQNAAVAATEDESVLKVLYNAVSTSGIGANAVYLTGEESTGMVIDASIETSGDYAHGILVTKYASMELTDVDITTSGDNSGAIAVALGDAAITGENVNVETSGANSPAINTTGDVTLANSVLTANGSEAVLVNTSEGESSVTLTDTGLVSSKDDKATVKLYKSVSSVEDDDEGTFTMTGGSLANTGSNGPLFYVTNTTGNINLTDVAVEVASGNLLYVAVSESGDVVSEGGEVFMTVDGQDLVGDIKADDASGFSLVLQNGSTLTGAINVEDTANIARLTLDAASTWNVTADSYLTKLFDEESISDNTVTNIIGNGYTVFYNSNANVYLKGKIYELSGGGYLKPLN